MSRTLTRGFSMIGMLVTMVCIVVLFAIGMSAMNNAVTGEGSVTGGSVRSMEDKLAFYALHQSMAVHAMGTGGRHLTPSELSGSDELSENTTASFFSAMVMKNYISPAQLISGNEYSIYVVKDADYSYRAYNPSAGVYWDPGFVADLEDISNVSFAHIPLFGDRHRYQWKSGADSGFPLLGNRGPRDGIPDPSSYTYGRDGSWAGHLVFGDGHIEFVNSFTPGSVFYERDGQRLPDNIFAVEDGMDGRDAILSFTKEMTEEGPVLQHD